MPIIGSALKFRFGPVQDDNGAAITGATWSLVSALKPDNSAFAVAYSENGNGVYTATTTAVSDQTGVWLLVSQTTVNGVVYTDSSQLDVLPDTGMTTARAAKLDSLDPVQGDDGIYFFTGNVGPLYVVPIAGVYTDAETGDRYRYPAGAVVALDRAITLGMPGADVCP